MDHFAIRNRREWTSRLIYIDYTFTRRYPEGAAGQSIPGRSRRRYGAEGYGSSIYITDPDGNTVELRARPKPPAKPHTAAFRESRPSVPQAWLALARS